LNRADLTAEKFVPNPFSEEPGERLYRTGDLARHLPDRNIEFLGRIDHQVKIRGFRIELGEIEHALLSQPEIKEAVVITHEREGGDKYLVAYVVGQLLSDKTGQVKLDQDQLREALKGGLPEYMVPSYFVQMEALPLTPNGKVDRKALLPPDGSQIQTKQYVAPRTELERALVSIWAEVLKLPKEKIGIRDNFFELGGHSLLVMQMKARIKKMVDFEISPQRIFMGPTISEIAHIINKEMNNRSLIEQLSSNATTQDENDVEEFTP
jgi:surfactin family lipopeptide synthetase A